MKRIRIYLVLQEFEDGRVMFRRISPDVEGQPPGGPFQKQSLAAFQWLLEQAWNFQTPSTITVNESGRWPEIVKVEFTTSEEEVTA